jgi:hypothetical protein
VTAEEPRYAAERAHIRQGGLRGAELIAWLAGHPPQQRDAAIEELLGIARRPLPRAPLGANLIGYIPSGVAPIVGAVAQVPIVAGDIFLDIGAGLGKVVMMVHLLSGVRARGVELQPALCEHAQTCARELELKDVSFLAADARDADLSDATVFFLYLPFTGGVLASVMARIRTVAERRAIVVCTLGLDLRGFDWLLERETASFWLSIYDSRLAGAEPRVLCPALPLGPHADDVAAEQ